MVELKDTIQFDWKADEMACLSAELKVTSMVEWRANEKENVKAVQ